MGTRRKHHGDSEVPRKSHGIPMDVSWEYHRSTMKPHGSTTEVPWELRNPVEVPQERHGSTIMGTSAGTSELP